MPPHLFHAFSDDPSRWERQFGCIAAIFQMFEQHPRTRLFRRRSASPSPVSSNSRHSYISESTAVVSKPSAGNSSRILKCKNSDQASIDSSAQTPRTEHLSSSTTSTFTSATTTATTKSKLLRHSKSSNSKNAATSKHSSPNIFDSSRATAAIREPPRKSVDASPDCTTNSSSTGSRSMPSSPNISRDGNKSKSHNRCQYFDPPRASVDSSSRRIKEFDHSAIDISNCRYRVDNADVVADVFGDPLQELKDSIRALAKLQQATQEFVDTFEAQRQLLQKQSCSSAGDAGFLNNRNSFRKCSVLDAPRTSSFDYTEAVRISQKIQEAPAPRLSLDGREVIPKIVLKLREAMRSARSGSQRSVSQINEVTQSSGYGNQVLDEGKSTSLRSALQAMKEEQEDDDSVSATAKSSVTGCSAISASTYSSHGRRSNVIAKLMGLDEIPTETHGNKSCNIAAVQKDQPAVLGDFLSCRRSGFNQSRDNQTVQRSLPRGNPADKKIKCCLIMDDHPLMEAPPPAPAPSPSISVSERQFNNQSIEEDDCKEIPEIVNDNTVLNPPCNLNPIKVKPATNAKHAMEVMPCSTNSPKLEKKLHKDHHGCKKLGFSQEEKPIASFRRQRSMEIQKTLRQAVADAVATQDKNSVSENKSLQEIIEAMKQKGLLRAHKASDNQTKDLYINQDLNNNNNSNNLQENRIVIIKPRKGRTLSMETQFPADDFPAAEDVKFAKLSQQRDVKLDREERQRRDGSGNGEVLSKRRSNKTEKIIKSNPVTEKGNPVSGKSYPVTGKRNAAQKTRKKANDTEDLSADMATVTQQRSSSWAGDVVKAAVSEKSEIRDSGNGSSEIEKPDNSSRRKRSLENIKRSIGRQLSAALSSNSGGNESKNHRKLNINNMIKKSRDSTIVSDDHVDRSVGRTALLCETVQPLTHESHAWVGHSAPEYDSCCRNPPSDTGNVSRDMTIITTTGGAPSVKCRNGTAPELLSPVSVLDSRYEEAADYLPLPYPSQKNYNNSNCKNNSAQLPEWRPPTGDPEYEYVQMVLKTAGVLDVRQLWPTNSTTAIDPAVFMQLEWQPETDCLIVKSAVERQKRRLVFDCVQEIVDGMVCSGRVFCSGRQWLPEAVWRDLEKLRKAPLNLAEVYSKGDGFVESLVERDLEQSQWKFWCPANFNSIALVGDSPTAEIASNLADSIFQDLVLEAVHMDLASII